MYVHPFWGHFSAAHWCQKYSNPFSNSFPITHSMSDVDIGTMTEIKDLSVILSSISLPTSISESIFRSDWLFPQNTPSGLLASLSFSRYHFHQCPSSPPYNRFLTLLTTSTVSLTPTVNAANVICQNKTDQISLSFCITMKCKARLCMI